MDKINIYINSKNRDLSEQSVILLLEYLKIY
jgi:hypothetical protein